MALVESMFLGYQYTVGGREIQWCFGLTILGTFYMINIRKYFSINKKTEQVSKIISRGLFLMAVKVAINGFGRIGRLAFRQMFGVPGFEIAAEDAGASFEVRFHPGAV